MSRPQRVLVGVSGGIAAYKVCELVSTLAKSEPPRPATEVRAVLTAAAQAFVAPLTFATLARHRAYTDADFWQASGDRPLHIDLGEWADLIVLAPLTAQTLAKLAHGLADNLLTNVLLASTCPVLVAPAMNTDMWQQVSVQRNWTLLQQDGRYHSVGPAAGRLACDRVGSGRMAAPAQILDHVYSLLHTQGRRDLSGQQVLISAGSTREYLDAVRFIGNPATGRMGIALAQAASHRGAAVTLVHGPLESALRDGLPENIHTVAVESAIDMATALERHQPQASLILMAAAVADVRPRHCAPGKQPKAKLPTALPLVSVADIVAQLAARKPPGQTLVGFAAQTGDVVAPAQRKRLEKGLDAIVANPIDQPDSGFASETNQVVWIDANRVVPLPSGSKLAVAHEIFDQLRG